jgi:hypothetical protein
MSDSRASSPGIRRFLSPLGVVTAVAVLGAGALVAVYVGSDDPQRLPAGLPSAPITPAPMAGILTGSPAPTATATANGAGGGAVDIATAPISLRYTFDGGLGRSIADADGQFPLTPISQNDGTLEFTPRDAGMAMRFPARCTIEEEICPRAILEGTRVDALNPGVRPLEYGASVLMTRDDLADGANVMQKGYSTGGVTQFKLQVDHLEGRPSCVIASKQKIYKVQPKIDIADGTWHALTCKRDGSQLTMTIDGVDSGSVVVPPTLSIANAEPLRIGGKGANARNDQFAGQIDDVHLTIS